MKKISVLVVVSLFFGMTGLMGNTALSEEGLTPANAALFIKTSRIRNLVNRISNYSENYLTSDQRALLLKERNEFRKKTGIDYFNPESLKKGGLDVERTVSFAYWQGERNVDVFLLLIPVIDEKTAPAKWVQIQNAITDDPAKSDQQPTVTSYKNRSIYRLRPDMFFSTRDGFLVITSSEQSLKEILDLGDGEGKNLATDPMFMDYLQHRSAELDVNIYARRDTIEKFGEAMKPQEVQPAPGGEDTMKEPGSGALLRPGYIPAVSQAGRESGGLKTIDYVSLGMGFDAGRIKLNAGARFNNSDPGIASIINLFKAGLFEKAIYIPDADAFSFISVDTANLLHMSNETGMAADQVRSVLKSIDDELGIDSRGDLLPYCTGLVTVTMGKPLVPDPTQSLALTVPMNDPAKTRELWEKIRKSAKRKHPAAGQFGEEKLGNASIFWYKNGRGSRISFACDDRGLYAGTDTALLKKVMAGSEIGKQSADRILYGKLNNRVVFVLFVKKNSIVHELMKMQATAAPGAAGVMASLGDLFLSCERDDLFFSIHMEMEMVKARK